MSSRSKQPRLTRNEGLMDVDEDGGLSENHQVMLQYLMHMRMTRKQDLSTVHGKLFHNRECLADTLLEITTKINPLKMDIKTVVCENTGEIYYVPIHSTGESYFSKCCLFNQSQLEFLKHVLTSIVLSGEGMIGKIEVLNSCKNLSKSEADETIRLFVREKVFVEVGNGNLSLSPLGVLEFEPFFRASLEDYLFTCDLCRQLVFVGKNCNGSACDKKFHQHCISKWLGNQRKECPNCQYVWTDDMEADTE